MCARWPPQRTVDRSDGADARPQNRRYHRRSAARWPPWTIPLLTSLADITRHREPRRSWHLDLVLPEIGGGRLQLAELTRIDEAPQATALTVSGLDQQAFEALVNRYGAQFLGLHLWKCPRVVDLSPLEDLPSLTHVAFYWNQRAVRLWDLSKTPSLKGLQFEDFTRLRSLDDLASATSLEELVFGDSVWVKTVFPSLSPVAELGNLRRLNFAVRRIEDGRVEPLARLRRLELFDCPSNLFTTEQLAWLRAHLPVTTQGRVLTPLRRLDRPLPGGGGAPPRDVQVMGKRKPWLSSTTDATRIERYASDFWSMVERFRASPELHPR